MEDVSNDNNDNDERIYFSATKVSWKNRIYKHNLSFPNTKKYATGILLSKYV